MKNQFKIGQTVQAANGKIGTIIDIRADDCTFPISADFNGLNFIFTSEGKYHDQDNFVSEWDID